MESSQPGKSFNFMLWLKLIGLATIVGLILFLLNKFGILKTNSEAEKLKDANEAKDEKSAIDFKSSDVLQTIKITDFLKTGVGATEAKNQFPYTPKQVTDMVTRIYKDKSSVGYSDGKNVIAVVNSLPSKFAFNRLASSFSDNYSDLMTWMDSNLHEKAIASVKRSMDLKPDFVKVLPATQVFLSKSKQTLTL